MWAAESAPRKNEWKPEELGPSGVGVLGDGVSMLGLIAVAGGCCAGVAGGCKRVTGRFPGTPGRAGDAETFRGDPEFRSERRHRGGAELTHAGWGFPRLASYRRKRCCLIAGRLTMVCGIVEGAGAARTVAAERVVHGEDGEDDDHHAREFAAVLRRLDTA